MSRLLSKQSTHHTMQNQMPSQYEIDRDQQRSNARQFRARQSAIEEVRKSVEHALSLDLNAKRIEKQVEAHENDVNGFQQRAHADRVAWNLRLIFCASILLYVFLEYIASGDVAEFLAHQMAPLFSVDPGAGETPIWLRRLAGVAFIGGMLGATLLLKFVTAWFSNLFKTTRSEVKPGEHLRYWGLTTVIGLIHLSKVAYVAAVAGLYIWLFGFAQERAIMIADIAAEQKQTAQWSDLGIKIEGGTVETDEAVKKSAAEATAPAQNSRLAGATGVFYVAIVMLHALVILLPTDGFGRDLELAHFKRGKSEARAASMRDEEGRTLRDVYERIRTASGEYQQDFIDVAMPCVPKINKLYGRPVIRMPEDYDQNPSFGRTYPEPVAEPQSGAVSRNQISPSGNRSSSTYQMAEHDEEPFNNETPVNVYDSIFPSAKQA